MRRLIAGDDRIVLKFVGTEQDYPLQLDELHVNTV